MTLAENNPQDLAAWFMEGPKVLSIFSFLGDPFRFDASKKDLLLQAFTHASYAHEYSDQNLPTNERLEFLGDAVLGALISDIITRRYPSLNEGELSVLRDAVVNENSLAQLALFMGIGKAILLGKGELKHQSGEEGERRESLLCDTFEALLGAIFQERGFDGLRKAFFFLLEKYRQQVGVSFVSLERVKNFNAKSRLQERTMALFKTLPKYKAWPLSNGHFQVELLIKGKRVGKVTESSKKRGEQKLAHQALAQLQEQLPEAPFHVF